MKTRHLAWVSAAALIAGTGIATADSKGEHGSFMTFFDTNKDGKVTLEEFNAAATKRFQRMDKDNDGKITQDEFRAYVQERRAEHQKKRFEKMDADKDGKISKAEYMAYEQAKAEKRFARMDKDGNGAIDPAEFGSSRDNDQHHARKGGRGGIFKHLDKDGDGVVTRQESIEAWDKWFKKIDADNDGVVTADEVAAYRRNKWSK